MALLMHRLGWKPKQVVDLQHHHYRRGGKTIQVPPAWGDGANASALPEVRVDQETRDALDRWLEHRKRFLTPALRGIAPFFCTHAAGQEGRRLYEGYLNRMLRRAAEKADIEKRVSPLVLRATYKKELEAQHAHALVRGALTHLDERRFRVSYPRAYERWLVAVTLFEEDAELHADRIGDECRKALAEYANEVIRAFEVVVRPGSGTHEKLRTALRSRAPSATGAGVAAALVRYWKETSGVAQSLAHATSRTARQRELGYEDARRAVFNTLFVMHETDHVLRVG